MNIITLDYETFFSDDYTLSKLSTEAYVRDPRFEAHGAAIRDQQRRWVDFHEILPHTVWVPHERLGEVFASYDWESTAVLAHHASFDGLILSHHYGVKPRFWFDSLSMARLLLGNHLSVGLDSLARHFGLAAKTVPYHLFKGKRWNELSADAKAQIGAGACHDVALTWQLFGILRKDFPAEEYQVIDTTIRMFTEPVLRADIPLLASIWQREETDKKARREALGVTSAELQSADKFAALLREAGIEPEMKEGKNGQIYAFAKTDEFMRGLREHEDPYVQGLVEARLGEKSTLMQTRAETLGWMARRGPMPVYLRYAGAHTTRWSGGDGCLAGDTKVMVFDPQKGLTTKNITDVLLDDLIWDGKDFVAHEGVVFQGFREVITHDGITGTPDHEVFLAEGGITTLEEAKKRGLRLERPRKPPR